MAKIEPAVTDIIANIDEAWENQVTEMRLSRLGASGVGEECPRAIYYSWRGYDDKKFPARVLRIFETGNIEEERIIADLRRGNLVVMDKDDNGYQFEFTDDSGHFVCKVDGIVRQVPGFEDQYHVLEIKTHNKDSFAALRKKGVKESKPAHYYQMQAGMWLTKLSAALYVAKCKDNEEYYVERVLLDENAVSTIQKRISNTLEADYTPSGISDNPDSFACKWCDFKSVCHENKTPIKNCRTCEFSVVGEKGSWVCGAYDAVLSLTDQLEACESYQRKGAP